MHPIYFHFPLLTFLIVLHNTSTPLALPLQSINQDSLQSTDFSQDFGRIIEETPKSVLKPTSPANISLLLISISSSRTQNNVTVAARGVGHSTYGQAETRGGIVIDMRSLPCSIRVHDIYVDVGGGSLWEDLLNETLKHGLSPRSWTDYLHLTVGGTLSNAGISGQTFKYGPQISNVIELDVVTGKGELVTCSKQKNSDLFYGVLGGLGQFGIITRARIILHPAPKMVKWVKISYSDFKQFTRHQEFLISKGEVLDYLQGYVEFQSNSSKAASSNLTISNVEYIIEFTINYNDKAIVQKRLDLVLSQLRVVRSKVNVSDVSYFEFLNRVKVEEEELRRKGLWEVPHPWLVLFVPKAHIYRFHDLLLHILSANYTGPLIIYPILKNKWNSKMSAMLPQVYPEENIFYVVNLLRSAPPSCGVGSQCLDVILAKNKKLIDISTSTPNKHIRSAWGGMGAKQYLPYWKNEKEWRAHFGTKWDQFQKLKEKYDPLHILAPGQRIFKRKQIKAQEECQL